MLGVSAARLLRANQQFKGVCIGDLEYCEKPLHFGEHAGNRFTIVLRHVLGGGAREEGAEGIDGGGVECEEVGGRKKRKREQKEEKRGRERRGASSDDEKIVRKAIKQLNKSGCINYFGHQRFGNSAASMMPSIQVRRLMSKEQCDA